MPGGSRGAAHAGPGAGAGGRLARGGGAARRDGPADACATGCTVTTRRARPACATGPGRGAGRGSRPSSWRSWRRSWSDGPDPETDGVVRWRRVDLQGADRGAASASSCTSARSASCCAGSASPACRCGPSTRRASPRRRSVQKDFAGLVQEALPEHAAGKPVEIWFAGRGPGRPAGHLDPDLGAPRHPAASAARPALRLGLPVRRGLPRAGGRRRAGAAVRQHRGDEPASAGDQPAGRPRRPRRPGAGRRRLAWPRRAGRVPRNLTLLPLPRYSPSSTRWRTSGSICARTSSACGSGPTTTAIVETCCQAWNALMAMPERLASITRREWAKPVTS